MQDQEIKDQEKNKRTWKAFVTFAGVCLILGLTGCGDSNVLTLKETEVLEQTEYISNSETENETENETEETAALDLGNDDTVYQVATDDSNLNVRENPDADSDIIAQLSNGEVVTGTGKTSGNWVQVCFSSISSDKVQSGWASENYLRPVTDRNTETGDVQQEEIIQEIEEIVDENQITQKQEEITIEGFMDFIREIVQEIDAGNFASASERLGSDISEENAEFVRWILNLYLRWMEEGYFFIDESGELKNTEAGQQAMEDEWAQELYAWADQQEQTAQYQEGEQGQDDEQYQDIIQIQEEEPAQVEAEPQVCGNCGGSGLIEVDTRTVCPICGGSGMQYIPNAIYDTIMGWQGTYVGCGGCGGSGYTGTVYYDTCSVCGGSGYF